MPHILWEPIAAGVAAPLRNIVDLIAERREDVVCANF